MTKSTIRASLSALALAAAALGSTPVAAQAVEPQTQSFLNSIAGGAPIYTLPVPDARGVLVAVQQSVPVTLAPASVEDRVLPIGPTGETSIRIYRPEGATETLPVIVYAHGGGWVLGDKSTHERLARELAVGAQAAVVFIDYARSPEARFPVAIEQLYSVLDHVAANPAAYGADASRIAVAGDSVGGNMAAVLALMAKERKGPQLAAQVLFYPVTDAAMDSASYREFADGPWLTAAAMAWFWDQYLPDVDQRDDVHASPINASREQLAGLPQAMVIVDENDVLRDEGEQYSRNLAAAGVPVTSVRYNGTIHDFVLLNPIAETPAVRGAVAQSIAFLRAAFAR